jgi:hypothetical protein
MSDFLPLLIRNMIEEYQQIIKYKELGIINYNKFTPTLETIKFGKFRWNENNLIFKRILRMTYNDKTLMIKTPKLQNVYSIVQDHPRKHLTISIDITTSKGKEFYNSMVELQNLVANEFYKNRVEWGMFKNRKIAYEMDKKDVFNCMTPIVKDEYWDEDMKILYPPTFNVSYNVRQNKRGEKEITNEVYDQNGKIIEKNQVYNYLTGGTYCKILMYAQGVWTQAEKFGICFFLKQIKVYPRLDQEVPIGKCLIDD